MNIANLSVKQLNKVLKIKSQIEKLEGQLSGLFSDSGDDAPSAVRKHKMSAAGRARIAAAQKARWVKAKGKTAAKAPEKKVRKMSAAGRAKIAAAARARWAKVKAAGKSSLEA